MTDETVDPDRDRARQTVAELGAAAVAEPVRLAPRLDAVTRRARVHRRRRRVSAVVVALAVLVPVGLGLWATVDGDQNRSERGITDPRAGKPDGPMTAPTDPTTLLPPVEETAVEVDPVLLAASPLAAREGAVTVWTGTEMVIWGGGSGGPGDGETFADGALYDPATDRWRMMAPSPLSSRARASAVWTGTEVLVWGGSPLVDGIGGHVDGAAYAPGSDTWRRLAPAPAGTDRSYPSAAWVDGHMVVGGGVSASGEIRDVLVYDAESDVWEQVDVGTDVVQVVAAGDRAAVITWEAGSRSVSGRPTLGVVWVHVARGAVEPGPDIELWVGTDDNIGAVWTGTELIAMARGPGGDLQGDHDGLFTSVAPDESHWRDRRPVPPGSRLLWPLDLERAREPTLLAWTGTDVVAFNSFLSRYDPTDGTAVLAPLPWQGGDLGCGYDAAQVWTGTEVIWWGGQSCRDDGVPLQVDTGARFALPSP